MVVDNQPDTLSRALITMRGSQLPTVEMIIIVSIELTFSCLTLLIADRSTRRASRSIEAPYMSRIMLWCHLKVIMNLKDCMSPTTTTYHTSAPITPQQWMVRTLDSLWWMEHTRTHRVPWPRSHKSCKARLIWLLASKCITRPSSSSRQVASNLCRIITHNSSISSSSNRLEHLNSSTIAVWNPKRSPPSRLSCSTSRLSLPRNNTN